MNCWASRGWGTTSTEVRIREDLTGALSAAGAYAQGPGQLPRDVTNPSFQATFMLTVLHKRLPIQFELQGCFGHVPVMKQESMNVLESSTCMSRKIFIQMLHYQVTSVQLTEIKSTIIKEQMINTNDFYLKQ